MTRAAQYLNAYDNGKLSATWELLDDAQKRYAAYLVKEYAYPVEIAIQRTFIFGYDSTPYNYRTKQLTGELVPKTAFGF